MSYVVEFSHKALDDFEQSQDLISDEIFRQFEKRLELLEQSPASWSNRGLAGSAYPKGQYYSFSCQDDRRLLTFNLLFKYGVDEQTLYVLRLTVTQTEPPSD
jgi:hypothetical protein